MVKLLSGIVAVIWGALVPACAFADPCTARLPKQVGEGFSGIVRYVGDGDSLCIGKTSDPKEWIEVRLADFDAPELHSPNGLRSKNFLERTVKGQEASCRVERGRSGRTNVWDRVIAACSVGGRSIGDLLRAAGAPAGGK